MRRGKKSRGIIRNIFTSLLLLIIIFLGYSYYCIVPVKDINVSELKNYNSDNYLSIEEIPKDLQNAFIAIEDHRFYSHFGVDPIAIVGSSIDNIKAKSIVRGGSTITQQLIKNTYLSPDKNLKRKIQEAFLAMRLERRLDKDEILELYLNTIYLAHDCIGVKEASLRYFNKNPENLNLPEAALLASITKSPAYYAPIKLKEFKAHDKNAIKSVRIDGKRYNVYINENAISRQKVVLTRMHELGYMDYNDYKEAIDYPIEKSINPVF